MRISLEDFIGRRPGLLQALNEYTGGGNVVLVAPTGYGKTLLSLKLLVESVERDISASLIHVAPYRALVREIFLEKFKQYYGDSGWQMHGELLDEDKSPYYLRKLVVTTLDSFIYNLYRLPVAEMRKIIQGRSQGHYYPVLASIFTSTIVFDEAHSYLGGEEGCGDESIKALQAAVKFLSLIKVPLVVETATMSSNLIATIVEMMKSGDRDVKVIYVGSAQRDQLSILGGAVKYVDDVEFSQSNSFNWITEIVSESKAFEKAIETCNSKPVLFIRNTVEKAVETYGKLGEKCGKAVLIHGLLSYVDREQALSKAKELLQKKKEGVIVSTQVIEAGVELGGSLLITDAAPVGSLAQRAGRLCRETHGYSGICRDEGAEVFVIAGQVYGPYTEEVVDETVEGIREIHIKGKEIDWRLLEDRSSFISFAKLMERMGEVGGGRRYSKYQVNPFRQYLESDSPPEELVKVLHELNLDLIYRGPLVLVAVPKEGGRLESLDDVEVVSVDARRIFKHEKRLPLGREKCLQYEGNSPLLLIAKNKRILKIAPAKLDVWKLNVEGLSAFELDVKLVPKHEVSSIVDVYLLARSECYERGIGLRVWG